MARPPPRVQRSGCSSSRRATPSDTFGDITGEGDGLFHNDTRLLSTFRLLVALCGAGVARYGDRDGAVHLLNNLFEAAAFFGLRLPELFCGFTRAAGEAPIAYPVACLPQAWAAGSVFVLLQACLGLSIDAPRDTMRISRSRLPAGIESLGIIGLCVGASRFDLAFRRVEGGLVAFVEPDGDTLHTRVEMRL